jgi:hypothetical protein
MGLNAENITGFLSQSINTQSTNHKRSLMLPINGIELTI